jgi:hypothetical protein
MGRLGDELKPGRTGQGLVVSGREGEEVEKSKKEATREGGSKWKG